MKSRLAATRFIVPSPRTSAGWPWKPHYIASGYGCVEAAGLGSCEGGVGIAVATEARGARCIDVHMWLWRW